MVYRNLSREMIRSLHHDLLRRAERASDVRDGTVDDDGPISIRSASLAGREVIVVTLTSAPHELLADHELGRILRLTARQVAVARLLAQRRTNPEIAAELAISESTVRRHAESVFARLDVNSRRDVETVIRNRVMDALYPRITAHQTTHERPVH